MQQQIRICKPKYTVKKYSEKTKKKKKKYTTANKKTVSNEGRGWANNEMKND